jgi:propanol-preferring alcohol dehydrogenase
MVLNRVVDITREKKPLTLVEMPLPVIKDNEILIEVTTCGVCHTELDEIEGRTPPGTFPRILGHQVVGRVIQNGKNAFRFQPGSRVGVAWIYSACGGCRFCQSGQENLCPQFKATGRDANGGYAQYMRVNEGFVYPIPDVFSDAEAAPLLCAGAIGYRSLQLSKLAEGQTLGLAGFGASAHLVLKLVRFLYPGVDIFVFSRTENEREFALELGAVWAGDFTERPPELINAIIDTTPVWKPVVEGLANLLPGGRLVINAIRKEQIDQNYLLKLQYPEHLWMEKEIKSVANVTRKDVSDFLDIAAKIPIKPEVQEYALEDANTALYELKTRKIRGAKVIRVA